MPKLASFDVFDTCLTRSYTFPTDLYADLAERFRDPLAILVGGTYRQFFVAARIQAERAALERSSFEEVTLTEIWQELCALVPELDVAEGVAEELRLEEASVRVNESCVQLIKTSRRAGNRLAFVSDSHLPAAFVWKLLLDHQIAQPGDGLYVSSECRLTKRTGRIFREVVDREHLRPQDIVHTGDNRHSDVAVPRAIGLATRIENHCGLSPSEAAIASLLGADRRVASRLSGEMRAFRLRAPASARPGLQRFVASFLGPFLVTFASWILARAKDDGIRRLYFVSRDGYLVGRVAALLSSSFGGPDCRYLYASRQSLFLPTVHAVTPESMPWLLRAFERASVRRLLAKIEMESEADSVLGALNSSGTEDMCLQGREEWQAFWRVLQSDASTGKILAIAETRRQSTLDYLHAAGLLEGTPWAIVDLGWTLSCQRALGDLLAHRGRTDPAVGYYLGLGIGRILENAAGPATAMFYEVPPDRATRFPSPAVFRRVDLLEHLVGLAPHGTVHHYESRAGAPIPVTRDISESAVLLSHELAGLATEFTRLVAPLAGELSRQDTAPAILETLTDVTFRAPERAWVSAVADIQVSEDQNNLGARPLAAPLTWIDAIAGAAPRAAQRVLRWERPRGVWSEGNQCISESAVRDAAVVSAWVWRNLREAVTHLFKRE